jgi:predicted P-loop ATPase
MTTAPREILPFRETLATSANVPKFLPVNPDPIPDAMKAVNRWLYWRAETKNGRPTKVPYVIGLPERHASSTDPATWGTFCDALAGMASSKGSFSYNGLGFAFQDSGIVFIDFDHVRNAQTGTILPWATEALAHLDSYTEISPSGNGLHTYTLGKLPGKGAQREFPDGSALEMYDTGRYATVTGHRLADFPQDVRPCDLRKVYALLKPAKSGSVIGLLEKFGLRIASTEDPFQGQTEIGVKYVLDACPFNPDHRDAAVFDFPSGPVFSCLHDSCTDNDWRAVCHKFGTQVPARLILGTEGKPRAVLHNAVSMLRHSPEWRDVLRFNEFSLYAETNQPAPWPQSIPGKNWTDDDDSRAACWLQQQGVMVNSKVAGEAAQTVARENPFHPVRDYLSGLSWDGKTRLVDFLTTYLGAELSPLSSAIGQRWMISAVARIMQPGCKADHVLLLEGVQGIGKSTALQVLASPPWFTDHLSDLGSKDSRIELHGKWIIELGEFASRRSELERKAFLTACADNFRAPYERRAQWVPRSNVFAATTNDPVPLTDETGGRRYWPVTCGRIDLEALRRDRDQLWAESLALYKAGEPWWDDFAEFREALAVEQESRYQGGPLDELILPWLKNPTPRLFDNRTDRTELRFDSQDGRVTILDCLVHACGKAQHEITQRDRMAVRDCLRHALWYREKVTRISPDHVARFYAKRVKL